MTPEEINLMLNTVPEVSEVAPTNKTGNSIWPALLFGALVIGLIVYYKYETQNEKATYYMYRG